MLATVFELIFKHLVWECIGILIFKNGQTNLNAIPTTTGRRIKVNSVLKSSKLTLQSKILTLMT